MIRDRLMLAVLAASISSAACSDEGDPAPHGPLSIVWESCPLETGGTGAGAECAEIPVPADWADPGRGEITLFLKRIQRAGANKQLWLLNGGPGASGADFEPLAEPFIDADPSIAIYLLDHRGTGRSHRLGCPQEDDSSEAGFGITEGEWPACIDAVVDSDGPILDTFSISQAARDLGELIEATREPDASVHVFGGSYGTIWAQRYIELYPEQAATVTMEGIVPFDGSFARYDREYDAVARKYLAVCAADELCASKLGPDPAARFGELYAALDAGHCPAARSVGVTTPMLREMFGSLLLSSYRERALVPALVYRLERCSPDDVAVIERFAGALGGGSLSVYERLHSIVLAFHIGISELWAEDAPSATDAEAFIDETVASLQSTLRMARRAPTWPVSAPTEPRGFGSREGPMRLLQGTLDPATPIEGADRVARAFSGPGQVYIVFPNATHSFDTPVAESQAWCSLVELLHFVQEPEADAIGCADHLEPLDFAGANLAPLYFGASDLWEGGVTQPMAGPDPRLDRLRRALRVRL